MIHSHLKHLCYICVTFVLHLCYICVTFVLHLCYICVTCYILDTFINNSESCNVVCGYVSCKWVFGNWT
jgi:hypothetical protein